MTLYMNTSFRFIALVLLLCTFSACEKDHSYADNTPVKITGSQIAGTWQLTQWYGAPIAGDLYFYITFESKGKTFEIYQNFDTAKARRLTGIYTLEYDEERGNVLNGIYDHASGFWNNTYLIGELSPGSMTWSVTDDASDVSIYTRCDAVPKDILKGTRAQ